MVWILKCLQYAFAKSSYLVMQKNVWMFVYAKECMHECVSPFLATCTPSLTKQSGPVGGREKEWASEVTEKGKEREGRKGGKKE